MVKRNNFKIASIYIGTVIGAGFASGQEISQFFGIYGIRGIYGIILSGISFGLIGAFVLKKVYNNKVKIFRDWLGDLGSFGSKIIEYFIGFLMLSMYCVMLAGSGALFQEQLGFTKEMGIVLMSLITFLTFLFGIKGLSIVNEILVPILVVGILSLGILVILENGGQLSNREGALIRPETGNWITAALLYVSYNSMGAIIVLSSLGSLITHKNIAIKGGLLGGLGLSIMGLFILIPILILYTDIKDVEIPMMAIANKYGSGVSLIYGFLLWFAMLTTAISNGFVVIQSISSKYNIRQSFICLLFCLGTIPLAGFGFKNLVSLLYPFFGYIGIIIIGILLWKSKLL